MSRARANGIDIEYETRGDPGHAPLLLVQGLSGQLTAWDDEFCDALAENGFWVIRYDNRDAGLSTRFEGVPDLAAILAGDVATRAYTLADMAADAAGLLDVLDVTAAHVVGVSMGGMIAQTLALDHPERCLTLTSIMSNTGAPGVGGPRDDVLAVLARPVPEGRAAIIEHELENARVAASPGYPFDEAWNRQRAARAYDRSWRPDGSLRQIAAVLGSPDRTDRLRHLAVPTLVIHGADDGLVDVSGGRATADAVPGARLVVLAGVGHELHPEVQPQIVEAITSHAFGSVPAGEVRS